MTLPGSDTSAMMPPSAFATTHWSVVAAAQASGAPDAQRALERLCAAYWYPLYAYVRRRGAGEDDAKDLVQAFFADFLERHSLQHVSPHKGRFRSFLLASLNHFLANEHDRASAQKRGGGRTVISLDAREAEDRYAFEPRNDDTPDKLFERAWVQALLDQAVGQLKAEYVGRGKREAFERLEPFLIRGEAEERYAAASLAVGQSAEAFKKSVQRMRGRFHQLFRELISRTVSNESEIEDELRHLCDVVRRA